MKKNENPKDMNTDKMRKIARIAGIGCGDREKIEHEFERRGVEYSLGRDEHADFWKYAKEMEHLSDDEFYTEANLNTLCNVMDEIDCMYAGQYKRASGEMSYPEDVVFAEGIDDLTKEFNDKMQKSFDFLREDLASIRAGRANPHVLDKIKVDNTIPSHTNQSVRIKTNGF